MVIFRSSFDDSVPEIVSSERRRSVEGGAWEPKILGAEFMASSLSLARVLPVTPSMMMMIMIKGRTEAQRGSF